MMNSSSADKKKTLLVIAIFCSFLLSDIKVHVHGLPYDYSFTAECLKTPLKAQYGGGIVVNPEINEGLKGWYAFGDGGKIETRFSIDDSINGFIVAFQRNSSNHSFAQKFNLEGQKLYTISAWVQLKEGESEVYAVFKTSSSEYIHAGKTIARSGCWSMLKGGLDLDASAIVEFYFYTENPSVELWADSICVQGFTKEEWQSHQYQSVEQTRKTNMRIQAIDSKGQPLPNTTISIQQVNGRFPLGCAINKNILNNPSYQNWFSSRFKYTVFENEMKWYTNEPNSGREDYSAADALIQFAKQRNIAVRGHNIFWDDPNFVQPWVRQLSAAQLSQATSKRINSVVRRYAGQLIHWDVVNENLHFSFYEQKLGPAASGNFFKQSNAIDGRAIPFLNDYNTIEESGDGASSPAQYIRKIRQIREVYNGPLGIGLEGHFRNPNFAYVRSAIDALASQRLPIWVTELDVQSGPNQARFLDQLISELHGHPAVNGILIWAAWSPQGCYRMCLTDNNFRNLETGNIVDKYLKQFGLEGGLQVKTDENGFFTASLYHGDYEASKVVTGAMEDSDHQISSSRFSVSPENKEGTLKIH